MLVGSSADFRAQTARRRRVLSPNGTEDMAKKGSRSGSENWVLSRLARDDLALLKPHLVGVDLPLFTQLETGHRPIYNIYFPERGFA